MILVIDIFDHLFKELRNSGNKYFEELSHIQGYPEYFTIKIMLFSF